MSEIKSKRQSLTFSKYADNVKTILQKYEFDTEFIDDNIGLVVEATGEYDNLSTSSNIKKDNITISEAVPVVRLTTNRMSKKVIGVISKIEKNNERRENKISSSFVGVVDKDKNRFWINSIGEGAIWVCNSNGNIENGDYLQSSNIKGYAEKQNDDLLHNYTIGKITCDVDFNNISEYTNKTLADGTICAFVGLIYHCG